MPNKKEILEQPEIAAFLTTHDGARDAVESAAEQLEKQSDAICAVNKLLRAHAEKVIFVFFSYKKKDEKTAKAIVQLLREISAEKLQISYQADITKEIVGQEWRNWIYDKIRMANWFILLLPDPSDEEILRLQARRSV